MVFPGYPHTSDWKERCLAISVVLTNGWTSFSPGKISLGVQAKIPFLALVWPYMGNGISLVPWNLYSGKYSIHALSVFWCHLCINKFLRGSYETDTLSSATTLKVTFLTWKWKGTSRETWYAWKPGFDCSCLHYLVIWDRSTSGYTTVLLMSQTSFMPSFSNDLNTSTWPWWWNSGICICGMMQYC